MNCPHCEFDNPPGMAFCGRCGTKLASLCPSCGFANPAGFEFCGKCGSRVAPDMGSRSGQPSARFTSPRAYTPKHLAEKILTTRSALTGERKQVTVLFVDVVGSTSIAERLDPEEMHQILDQAFELMLGEIHRYEGTVNQFLGDGLMALFGAPVAHEDHAVRAVHASLGIQRLLAEYAARLRAERGIEFKMRIGLNTGLVVVGAIGNDLRMDYTAIGDTTNLAARMQQHASPGSVLIAEPTYRLIGGYFETRPVGPLTVKGKSEPIQAYEVLGARHGRTRLDLAAERGLTPYIGRQRELDTLWVAWQEVKQHRGQIVFITGEAGMGKSRLLLEFRSRLADEALTWLEGHCISFGQSIAYLPVIELLKGHFDVEDQDSEAEIIEKVDQGLAPLGSDATAVAPFVKYLLSVDPGDPSVVTMDPLARRSRMLDALRQITLRASRSRPIVMVIEDLHWIDQASEDYLKFIADSFAGASVLLILNYRPGYLHPLGDRTYHSRIVLQPLSPEESARMAQGVLDASDMPDEVRTMITRKAEGNPFFLEEIVRSLVESGALCRENGRYVIARATDEIFVPDTINGVIMARIDRLADEQKRTIQVASVIGREFALRLLRRVADAAERVEHALAELRSLEFVYEKAAAADVEYVFKHALTQDVAYESILQTRRRALHAGIGAAIEELYADRLEERSEELVHHMTRGEVWEKAARYARGAGDRAAALCVDSKAVEFYEQALEALGRLPETRDTGRIGVDLRLALRAPLWRAGRLDRLFEIFKEAEALATKYGETERLDIVYSFFVQYYWAKGEQDQAIAYGQRCLETAETRNDLGLAITGRFYLGHAYHALGQFSRALEHLREIISALEGPRETERFGLSGLPYCGACALGAECLAELGDHAGALELVRRGERVANVADHLYSKTVLAVAHGYVLIHHGSATDAIAVLEPAVAICREKKFAGQTMRALTGLGHACALVGRPLDGIPLVKEAIEMQEKAGAFVNRAFWLRTLAEIYLHAGQLGNAEATARDALGFAERHGERWCEGWSEWVLGEAALRRGDRETVAQHIAKAQSIAIALALRPLAQRCRDLLSRIAS